jgi:hypothetical protein
VKIHSYWDLGFFKGPRKSTSESADFTRTFEE